MCFPSLQAVLGVWAAWAESEAWGALEESVGSVASGASEVLRLGSAL